MSQRVLDANRLIAHWRQCMASARSPHTADRARTWARELIALRGSKAIVTPVQVEFLGGTRNAGELARMRAFLAEFAIIDKRRILPQDWRLALDLAARIPSNGRPRGALDCLIRAIAERLHHDVDTADSGMPRTNPPARSRTRPGRRR